MGRVSLVNAYDYRSVCRILQPYDFMKGGGLMKKAAIVFVMVVSLVGFMTVCNALANPELDFDIPGAQPSTASINYAVSGGPLVGTNILVDYVNGVDHTPANDGNPLTITGGSLNFSTGNFTGTSSSEWLFGAGGTISMTGGISSLGLGNSTALIYSGTFESAEVLDLGNHQKEITGSVFLNYVNSTLAGYYGLPTTVPYEGNFNISFEVNNPVVGQTFSSDAVHSGDLEDSPLPEPASLVLVVGTLLLLGFTQRRRLGSFA